MKINKWYKKAQEAGVGKENQQSSQQLSILVLDDMDERLDEFSKRFQELKQKGIDVSSVMVKTAAECIGALQSGTFSVIFLDHDLGDRVFVNASDTNTGSEVVRWFELNPGNPNFNATVIVHSLNSPAANRMVAAFPNAIYMPFAWTRENFHKLFNIN